MTPCLSSSLVASSLVALKPLGGMNDHQYTQRWLSWPHKDGDTFSTCITNRTSKNLVKNLFEKTATFLHCRSCDNFKGYPSKNTEYRMPMLWKKWHNSAYPTTIAGLLADWNSSCNTYMTSCFWSYTVKIYSLCFLFSANETLLLQCQLRYIQYKWRTYLQGKAMYNKGNADSLPQTTGSISK